MATLVSRPSGLLLDWSAYRSSILGNNNDSESGLRGGVPECQYPLCVGGGLLVLTMVTL